MKAVTVSWIQNWLDFVWRIIVIYVFPRNDASIPAPEIKLMDCGLKHLNNSTILRQLLLSIIIDFPRPSLYGIQ